MKLEVMNKTLATALEAVGVAVATRTTLPVLSNVLIEPDTTRVRVTTNNLEMAISVSIPATILDGGAITLPHKPLTAILSSLPDERLDLEVDEKRVGTLRNGPNKFTLKGIDAGEFPTPLPPDQMVATIRVGSKLLFEKLAKVATCVAKDDSRPVLHGILLTAQAGKLTLAAADGFRLGVATLDLLEMFDEFSAVMPLESSIKLAKAHKVLHGKEDVELTICIYERNSTYYNPRTKQQEPMVIRTIEVNSPQYRAAIETIDGVFPDYTQIIPTGASAVATFEVASVQEKLKRAFVYAKEANGTILLEPSEDKQVMYIRSKAAEYGEYEGITDAVVVGHMDEVPAYGGPVGAGKKDFPDQIIGVRYEYLTEALKQLGAERAMLSLVRNDKPLVLKTAEDPSILFVIMPMHIGR